MKNIREIIADWTLVSIVLQIVGFRYNTTGTLLSIVSPLNTITTPNASKIKKDFNSIGKNLENQNNDSSDNYSYNCSDYSAKDIIDTVIEIINLRNAIPSQTVEIVESVYIQCLETNAHRGYDHSILLFMKYLLKRLYINHKECQHLCEQESHNSIMDCKIGWCEQIKIDCFNYSRLIPICNINNNKNYNYNINYHITHSPRLIINDTELIRKITIDNPTNNFNKCIIHCCNLTIIIESRADNAIQEKKELRKNANKISFSENDNYNVMRQLKDFYDFSKITIEELISEFDGNLDEIKYLNEYIQYGTNYTDKLSYLKIILAHVLRMQDNFHFYSD